MLGCIREIFLCGEFPISSSSVFFVTGFGHFHSEYIVSLSISSYFPGISTPAFIAFIEFVLKGAMARASLSRKLTIIQNPLFSA